ncbi:F-box/LRR-repeat protein 13 [Triticum aestivum]|uniref:F-box/LRR-repeat protein 13 n=1 Tax=Triticum aestivum TaxID=4565 RepID=UPI0008429EDA|nr:F-box/LRR-repeat protein 13-like [Triticum aestivum]
MEEALAASAAASVAASAAAETAKEAALAASAAAKEPAAAAAVTATEAAVTASAAASNAKEAASVAATTGAAAAASAAMQASKKRKFHLHDDQDTPASDNRDDADERSVDHISRLPDAVLGSIVSLLATKEGARTQAISRRWRPLWRSAPLNLVVGRELINKTHKLVDLIPKILSQHRGPTRRFLLCFCIDDCYDRIGGWLSSQALDSLQELQLNPKHWFADRKKLYPLPPSAYRFSPTLRVAKFHGFHLPDLTGQPSLKFPVPGASDPGEGHHLGSRSPEHALGLRCLGKPRAQGKFGHWSPLHQLPNSEGSGLLR